MLEEIRKGQQPEESVRKNTYKNTPRMTSSPIHSQSNENNQSLKDITNNENISPPAPLITGRRNVEECLMSEDNDIVDSQVLQSVPNKVCNCYILDNY